MGNPPFRPGDKAPMISPSFSRAFIASEFSAFCLAGKAHHIEQRRVLDDFRKYLHEGSVPGYVADSIRWNVAARGKSNA